MKIALILLVVLLISLILIEIALRYFYGFGDPLLYVADAQMGYRIAPNQTVRRYGNQIHINQYSMRSGAIRPERPAETLRVLLLGDSIANGGWWTDQADILSAMMAKQLQVAQSSASWGESLTDVEVLNASANSWGPRNELAYLMRFGHFQAQVIVLLINTDDLFTIAPTSLQVGRDRNYPNRKPPLAWVEVLQRYLFKPKPIPELQALRQERVGANIEAMRQIQKIANQENIHYLIAMTPLLREVEESGPRDYELKARQRLLDFSQFAKIPYIDFLPLFQAAPDSDALFRDNIHLSPMGNELVCDRITQEIQRLLTTPTSSSLSLAPEPLSEEVLDDPWS